MTRRNPRRNTPPPKMYAWECAACGFDWPVPATAQLMHGGFVPCPKCRSRAWERRQQNQPHNYAAEVAEHVKEHGNGQ